MAQEETLYPFEIVIEGMPMSQGASSDSRKAWKSKVRQIARERQQETYSLGFLDHRPLMVTIYFFAREPMGGDVDNIVKPIMDALIGVAYLDDRVVERATVQKFEPGVEKVFLTTSAQLAAALDKAPPVVYVRVDDDLSWRRLS